ncbi:uncharacterized protein LOC123680183 [Harmonia axyridis]|uniref:uncharacterized protein LOC123680183 n=1 Tax=Harmonia axyridis TaxID=115357 RepID=UPI001E275129|nr:uncharacterized protein LOC123680183 [Harmonia axyridis]
MYKKALQALQRSKRTEKEKQTTHPYWWSRDVEVARGNYLRARRNYTRMGRRNHGNRNSECEEMRKLGNELKKIINREKREKWKDLLRKLDLDIWGDAYKITTNHMKFRSLPYKLSASRRRQILRDLFPLGGKPIKRTGGPRTFFEPLQMEELKTAVESMKAGRAPGPDGMTAENLKIVCEIVPEQLLDMFNKLIEERIFPSVGRKQRLDIELMENRAISPNQHGFVKKRSTLTAMLRVQDIVRKTNSKWMVAVTIDVKNAFNTVRWHHIVDKLKEIGCSEYLVETIEDYFRDRWVRVAP